MDYKQWRKDNRLNQADAGKIIGVSYFVWGDIESGKQRYTTRGGKPARFLPGEEECIQRLLVAFEHGRWPAINQFPVTQQEVKALRLRNKWSKADLAEHIGCSESHAAKLEGSTKEIGNRYRLALAALILEEPDQTTQDTPEPEPSPEPDFVSDSSAQVVPYRFDDRIIQVVQADEVMMTDRQLGEALEYAQPKAAINQLAAAHADELKDHQTVIDLITVDGSSRSVRVWRERGISILSFHSQQPKAKVFRQYAADVLYQSRRGQTDAASDNTIEILAKLMGLRSEQALTDAIAYTDRRLAEASEQMGQQIDKMVSDRLQAEKDASLLVADKRRVVRENIAHIVRHIAGAHSPKWFARVTNDLKEALRINKFDDIIDNRLADNALEWLRTEAKRHGCILPAYQQPLAFGEAV